MGRARPRRSTIRGTRISSMPADERCAGPRQIGGAGQLEDATKRAVVTFCAIVGRSDAGPQLWPLLPFDDERIAERVDLHVGWLHPGDLDLEDVVAPVRAQIRHQPDCGAIAAIGLK